MKNKHILDYIDADPFLALVKMLLSFFFICEIIFIIWVLL